MKLIAKKGTAFEQAVKAMCEKMTDGINGALDLTERMTGLRPKNVFHLFHWGTISKLVPEFDIHPDDLGKVDPRYLRKKKGGRNVYVPARRYKEGAVFSEAFCAFAKEHEITDEPLQAFGINMVDWKRGVSYSIVPAHDTERDLYILVCSNSLPEAFDKDRLARDEFDIEY